jgi:hypothetical protein
VNTLIIFAFKILIILIGKDEEVRRGRRLRTNKEEKRFHGRSRLAPVLVQPACIQEVQLDAHLAGTHSEEPL